MSKSALPKVSNIAALLALSIVALSLAYGCRKDGDNAIPATENVTTPKRPPSAPEPPHRLGITEGTFVDQRDGQTYRYVTYDPAFTRVRVELDLGKDIEGHSIVTSEPDRYRRHPPQTWMVDNLNYSGDDRVGHRTYQLGMCFGIAGDSVAAHRDSSTCAAGVGRLYDWPTAMALAESTWTANRAAADKNCSTITCQNRIGPVHQGICPVGWHVPSVDEWDLIVSIFSLESQFLDYKVTPEDCGPDCDPPPRLPLYSLMKAITKKYPKWNHETDAKNPFRFSVKPISENWGVDFWTMTEKPNFRRDSASLLKNPATPDVYSIRYDHREIDRNPNNLDMTDHASIRCVKDAGQIPSQGPPSLPRHGIDPVGANR
jgi:uncharacterized protein (TIGR02145 family)